MLKWIRSLALPFIVAILLFGVFVVIAYLSWVKIQEQNHDRLLHKISIENKTMLANIQQVVSEYSTIIYGLKAMFNGSDQVSRAEWKEYVDTLDLVNRYPAITALEYIRIVDAEDKQEFEASVQADDSVHREGYADFSIFPEGDRDHYYVVDFVEPFVPNIKAFGYDPGSNPSRYATFQLARDLNQMVVTEPFVLIQDEGMDQSFIFMVPVYKSKAEVSTLAGRREHILGYVQGIVRAEDMFSYIIRSSNLVDVEVVTVRDVTDRIQVLMPELNNFGGRLGSDNTHYQIVQRSVIPVGTRKWEVELKSNKQPKEDQGIEGLTPLLILTLGGVVSFLVGMVLWGMMRLKIQAEKRAQELTQDLQKFKLAVEGASDHIVITDAEGIALYVNKAVERITGYSADEALGQKAGTLWGRLMDENYYHKMWKRIKTEKKVYNGELQNRRKNGEIYDASVSISPVLNAKGEVQYFVGIERDITHEKDIDRMKTEFLSVAAHQLRTPLGTMRWNTEIAMDGAYGKLNPELKESLMVNYKNNLRLLTLVNDLLDVTRIDQGRVADNPTMTDLPELVKSTVAELKKLAAKKRITLEVSSRCKSHSLMIDANRLKEVVENLVSNAIKYTQNYGLVEVLVHSDGHEFVINVKDNGIGIPTSDKQKIFTKFYRAKNAAVSETEGSGLGLYVVKAYVDAWGGRVEFTTTEGKGTTFYVTIPAKPKAHILDKNLLNRPQQSA